MNKVGCVLLAGGAGRRMGKQNKLNMPLGASSFGEIIKQELRTLTEKCYISVAEYPYELDDDFLVVIDAIKDDNGSFIGPMGGIYSTLKQALIDGLKGVFVVSCDMPYFKGEIFEKLLPYIDNKDVVLLKSSDGHIHYTCGYYSTNTLDAFLDMIIAKKYRIRDIIDECDSLIIDSRQLGINDHLFFNVNDREQYEKLLIENGNF